MKDKDLADAIEKLKDGIGVINKKYGCYALNFDHFGGENIQLQIHEDYLDLLEGELKITERDDTSFPYELSKVFNGVKFFSIIR